MVKINLVDVQLDEEFGATFGTCELCMSYGNYVAQPTYIFKRLDTNEEVRVEGYEWDWGDYDEITIDNIIEFANWISSQEFVDDDDLFSYGWLHDLVYDYYEFQESKKGVTN